MDFIDYDTFQNDTTTNENNGGLPEPAPPLILPINPGITNKFKNLSILKNHLGENIDKSNEAGNDDSDVNTTSRTAEKYAKISIDLLNSNNQSQHDEQLISDLPISSGTNKSDQTDKLNSHLQSGSKVTSTSVLSAKLSKVLNTYDSNDPKLREAIQLLQNKKIMDIDQLVQTDLLGSIARRNFRSEIENDLLKQHSSVLKEFQPVVTKIETIGEKIERLNKINDQFQKFDKLDPELIAKIEKLSTEKNILKLKKSMLLNFKKKFTLNQYEEHVLLNEDISTNFFQVLEKCKKIHSNCSILLTLGNQDLGLNIMKKMDKFLNSSYQRLSFYLENKLLKNLNTQDALSSSKELKFLKISFYHLHDNVEIFNQIINKLVQLRSKSLVDEFLYQLDNADSTDDHLSSRPIVLSAHDPLRYIGDILAYVHSTMVNEVEFIKILFQQDEEFKTTDDQEDILQFGNQETLESITNDTLIKIINSLARPLKIRIEQIVRSERNLEVIQKIYNLLDLFQMMYEKNLPTSQIPNCTVLQNLDGLKQLTVEKVFGVLKEKLTVAKTTNIESSDDLLLPPDWIRDYLTDALSLFEDANFGSEEHIFKLSDDVFNNLLEVIIDQPVEILTTFSKKITDKRDQQIFKLNYLDLIQSKIITVPQLSTKNYQINDQITTIKTELINNQYELLLKFSQLSIHQQLITLIFPIDQIETEDDYAMYASLIENKLFGKEKLQEIETQLHEFLPVALIDIQQSLFKISSPLIANDIIIDSSLKYLHLYVVFFKILQEIYPDDKILEWSPYDVATLLGVEEAYKSSSFAS